jgi:biotin carboxyl carrier protein
MLQATINETKFEITENEDGLVIDGKPLSWDLVKISEDTFHIVYNQKSYRAEVVRTDAATKTFTFKINGKTYTVGLKNKFDLLLEKMGMNNGASGKVNNIKAPMPGLIINLKVKEGDVVRQNDPLLILEAMKMENVIKSPGDGVVKHVKIKKGDSVEKNQVLIEF